jgi:hypothetical protein
MWVLLRWKLKSSSVFFKGFGIELSKAALFYLFMFYLFHTSKYYHHLYLQKELHRVVKIYMSV